MKRKRDGRSVRRKNGSDLDIFPGFHAMLVRFLNLRDLSIISSVSKRWSKFLENQIKILIETLPIEIIVRSEELGELKYILIKIGYFNRPVDFHKPVSPKQCLLNPFDGNTYKECRLKPCETKSGEITTNINFSSYEVGRSILTNYPSGYCQVNQLGTLFLPTCQPIIPKYEDGYEISDIMVGDIMK